MDAFLAGTRSRVRTLADVIAFNDEDRAARVPFGQDLLVGSQQSLTSEAEYRATEKGARARARETIDGMLAEDTLDLLLSIGTPFYIPYCAAGYPALVVPASMSPFASLR